MLIIMDQDNLPSPNKTDQVDGNGAVTIKQDCNEIPDHSHHFSKDSILDSVVGANDEELAKRQYIDEEIDDLDETDVKPNSKRFAPSLDIPAILHEKQFNDENLLEDAIPTNVNGYKECHLSDREQSQNSEPIGNRFDNSRVSDEPEQMRKLFIGGLDYKTSEETLRRHFERFGDVMDCVVVREPQSKRSRGFGFVIYSSLSMVDKAQLARPHEIDGRLVQSKRAVSREDSGKPEAQATVRKVYLGGLSDDIGEPELREYFKEFGNIVNIIIVAHKDTGKRRGFAFIEYDDHDPVDKIVLKQFHSIKDKRVEAKKAIPKVEMDARKRSDPRSAMAGAMMALTGGGLTSSSLEGQVRSARSASRGAGGLLGHGYLWDSPYGPHQSYPTGPLDGYAPHYHPAQAHYGSNWMGPAGSGQSGPYGFRNTHVAGSYGRGGYPGQAAVAAAAAAAVGGWPIPDFGSYPTISPQTGGTIGPTRINYQHRSFRPYTNGGSGGHGSSNRSGTPTSRRGYNL